MKVKVRYIIMMVQLTEMRLFLFELVPVVLMCKHEVWFQCSRHSIASYRITETFIRVCVCMSVLLLNTVRGFRFSLKRKNNNFEIICCALNMCHIKSCKYWKSERERKKENSWQWNHDGKPLHDIHFCVDLSNVKDFQHIGSHHF